jgi:hypothetical protein
VSLFIVASGAVCFPLHGCSLVIGPLIKVQLKIFARARGRNANYDKIYANFRIHPSGALSLLSRAPRACIGGVVACVNCIIKIASAQKHTRTNAEDEFCTL